MIGRRGFITGLADAVFWICIIVLALAAYDWLKQPPHREPAFKVYSI